MTYVADNLEDWVLASAPKFVAGMKQAEQEYLKRETVTLDAALAEIALEEQTSS